MFTAKETFSNTKNLSKLPRVITATELRLPGVETPRSISKGGIPSGTLGVVWRIFQGRDNHSENELWFTFTTYLKICKIVLEEILTPRDSNRFPSGECTRESLTNTNISADI